MDNLEWYKARQRELEVLLKEVSALCPAEYKYLIEVALEIEKGIN